MFDSIFLFLGKSLDLITSIFKQKNTDQVINNNIAQQKAHLTDKVGEDVAKKDVEQTRKDLSL